MIPDWVFDLIAIFVASLVIAGAAFALVLLRPAARRRRRHKRHARRNRIDLCVPSDSPSEKPTA